MGDTLDILTHGEILLRLSPAGGSRLADASLLEQHIGGAELNVACGDAQLGLTTAILSRIPQNGLGAAIRKQIRSFGVRDGFLLEDPSPQARLGIYYYEPGASPRKPSVIYDRGGTSAARIRPEDLPKDLPVPRLFHTSGITLAVSPDARRTALELIRRFSGKALISFDVNYRARLWSEEEAHSVITELLPMVDILFISEESCRRMFGMDGPLEEVQRSLAETYHIHQIFTTSRTAVSPREHIFTSLAYDNAENAWYTESAYTGIEAVDRIGSGDAYVAGALYGLLGRRSVQDAVWYGNAMAAMKSTVPGDLPSVTLEELQALIAAHHGEGSASEMNR